MIDILLIPRDRAGPGLVSWFEPAAHIAATARLRLSQFWPPVYGGPDEEPKGSPASAPQVHW